MRQEASSKNKKINLWIFNQYAYPPDQPGNTRHFDFARHLSEHNIRTYIFASDFHGMLKKTMRSLNKPYLIENIEGVTFIFLKSLQYKSNGAKRVLNMLLHSLALIKYPINLNLPMPDLIIGSSPSLFDAYAAYIVSKKLKVPFLIEVRDIWPLSLVDLGQSKYHPFIIISSLMERFLYRKSKKIIMLMPSGSKYLKQIGIRSKKSIWISNGIDLSILSRQKESKQKLKANVFNITYAGTLGQANDIENIISAAELLKNHKQIVINLIGDGVLKDYVRDKIKQLKLINLKMYPPVPRSEIFVFLKKSDALLFTLKKADVFKYGNPPNKIFDYMAASKPIIFASSASNNLVAESGCGISVKPSDPHELSGAIIKTFNMSSKARSNMGRRGYGFVKKHYSIANLAQKLNDEIRSVL